MYILRRLLWWNVLTIDGASLDVGEYFVEGWGWIRKYVGAAGLYGDVEGNSDLFGVADVGGESRVSIECLDGCV